ncbi:UNVERIFIED_CONTAM: hypothetical protein DES50_11469 [Williamsia faeni]
MSVIRLWAWVVNGSLAAAHPTSALLQCRAAAEHAELAAITDHAERYAVVPVLAEEPVGVEALTALTGSAVSAV